VLTAHFASLGLSVQLPSIVQNLLLKFGLENLQSKNYASAESEEKIAVARELRMQSHKTPLLRNAILVTGVSEEEVVNFVEEYTRILQRGFDDGWAPLTPLVSVIGQCSSRRCLAM